MYVYYIDKRNLMQGKQVNEYDTDDVKLKTSKLPFPFWKIMIRIYTYVSLWFSWWQHTVPLW